MTKGQPIKLLPSPCAAGPRPPFRLVPLDSKRRGMNSGSGVRFAFAGAVMILGIGGCSMGADYRRPDLGLPANYRGAPASPAAGSFGDLPWRQVFKDPALQDLLQTALANNLDLRIAVSRIEQARAIQAQVFSELLPQVGYEGGVNRGKNEFLGGPKNVDGSTQNSAYAALAVAWEIDLWGRIRRLNEAALDRLLGTEEAQRGVTLSLLSEVAQAYFDLLALDERLKVAQTATQAFAETLGLFKDRLEGGKASILATSRAEGALNTSAAQIHDLTRAISEIENEISVLLGRAPAPIVRGSALLDQALLPRVPPGLPSELLERRPDIRAAECEVRARNAEIGAALADYFPRLGLTTLLGKVTPNSGFGLGSNAANLWSVGAALTGPIFEGGRLRAQEDQVRAQLEEALAQYQKAVIIALAEVSRALVAREELEQAFDRRRQAVQAYGVAVQTANERFNAGKSSYYEVLEAQQLLFPAQDAMVQTRLDQLRTLAFLYKALGGGWQTP
jgi:multidrug efflux system outer membrane protein